RTAQRAVHDIKLVGVEKRREQIAPAPLATIAATSAVAHGGIADEIQGRQIRVRGQIGEATAARRRIRRRGVIRLRREVDRSCNEDCRRGEPMKTSRFHISEIFEEIHLSKWSFGASERNWAA